MKKQYVLSILSFLLLPFFGLHANQAVDNPELSDMRIIEVHNLTQEEFDEITEGLLQDKYNIIFQFSEGMFFPVDLFIKGDLFSCLEKPKNAMQVCVLKTFYVRPKDWDLLCSDDLHVWQPVDEFFEKNLKLKIGFEEEIPFFHWTYKLKKRS